MIPKTIIDNGELRISLVCLEKTTDSTSGYFTIKTPVFFHYHDCYKNDTSSQKVLRQKIIDGLKKSIKDINNIIDTI